MAKNKNRIQSSSNPPKVSMDVGSTLRIKSYDEIFPCPICLELCETKITQGYEKHVIKTLKAFSDKEKFETKCAHPLIRSEKLKHVFNKAENFNCDKVYSLDVKSRHDKYRLYYCITDNGVYKILELCSEKSHKN